MRSHITAKAQSAADATLTGPWFGDESAARDFLEKARWPRGPVCPHCGANGAYRLRPKAESRRPVRPGVLKCRACRRQFAVTVGTIFEDSHIPLSKWLVGIQLLCAGRDGVGARDLRRVLGVSYKTASFMTRRLRRAIARVAVPHDGAGRGTPDGRLGRVVRSRATVARDHHTEARPRARRATSRPRPQRRG
jgi:transposase-like protein